ncbi:MAG TPA: hypothetical protein VI756_28125 [Blastocatellia bacterium]
MSSILSESTEPFGPASTDAGGETAVSIVAALKSEISTLGGQVDSYKARTAGAFGAAVFLLLLAAGGFYDLVTHNNAVRSALGISIETFQGIVAVLGSAGLLLALIGIVRQVRCNSALEHRLEQLEQELADHLDHLDHLDRLSELDLMP